MKLQAKSVQDNEDSAVQWKSLKSSKLSEKWKMEEYKFWRVGSEGATGSSAVNWRDEAKMRVH